MNKIAFKLRHRGPFQARTGSVMDLGTGTYIAFCPFDHHGNPLDGEQNAETIAKALNHYFDLYLDKS